MEHNWDEEFTRFGYISCNDGDKLSYAKQSSEGSFIILDKHTFIKAKHIFYARVPKKGNSNAIVFGVTSGEDNKLVGWTSLAKNWWSRSLTVHFELKHSYFQRLHVALERISQEMIAKIMPNHENFVVDKKRPEWDLSGNEHKSLELDSYQERALRTILNCSPGALVLVTGPFGTGKTRLLARAAYEILKLRKSKVLICAHHQASVDTFVEILGDIIDNNIMIRVTPNEYHSPTKNAYPDIFMPKPQMYKDGYSVTYRDVKRLVITTLGTLTISSKFSHILIDEGAQTREPEIIGPLRFAQDWTRTIIAGDHLQVCAALLLHD